MFGIPVLQIGKGYINSPTSLKFDDTLHYRKWLISVYCCAFQCINWTAEVWSFLSETYTVYYSIFTVAQAMYHWEGWYRCTWISFAGYGIWSLKFGSSDCSYWTGYTSFESSWSAYFDYLIVLHQIHDIASIYWAYCNKYCWLWRELAMNLVY